MHLYTYTDEYMYVCVNSYICIYMCRSVCKYIYIYIYTHVYV